MTPVQNVWTPNLWTANLRAETGDKTCVAKAQHVHAQHTHTHRSALHTRSEREGRGLQGEGVWLQKGERTSTTPSLDEALPDALPPPAPAQHAAESRNQKAGGGLAGLSLPQLTFARANEQPVQLCDAATVTLQAKEGILVRSMVRSMLCAHSFTLAASLFSHSGYYYAVQPRNGTFAAMMRDSRQRSAATVIASLRAVGPTSRSCFDISRADEGLGPWALARELRPQASGRAVCAFRYRPLGVCLVL